MKHTPLISMLAMFGLGIGAANAAPPPHHAHGNLEPGQSRGTLQRKQNIAVVARNHHLFRQPKTQREAVATLMAQPSGALGIAVPESLWNTLSVQRDGSVVRVLESDGTTPAPATTTEGAPNE
jgi:hypothetical protein